ncbi:MAG: hypothetical protein M3Z37_01870, partial [Candidatus Eremiobacteraeota bacterium]|nr:hypothetical protein [Candidatus Eremiobacteraeota bacterium]
MATPAATGPSDGKGADAALHARVSATLVQARQHLIRNNAAAALSQLKEIAALPDCPADIRLEAAKMLATAGANAEAALCYLNAGLGYLYDHGDMAKARQAFASAHNIDPHNLDVIFHLGQADVVEGRTQDGLAKFIDVLRKSNLKHTPALFEAGCIYQANGQYDQAILAFKKVLDREKNHIQAVVHMGQLHQIKGMVPEAISYYMQAAQITREEQQFGTTRQIANMVLAIDSNNHRARTLLADLDESKEEEEEAPGPAPKAASAGVPPRKVAAPAAASPSPAPEVAAEPSAPSAPSAQEAATRAAAAAASSAAHDEAIRQSDTARRQAEAAAQDAELARKQAEAARQDAEEARQRAEGELLTIRAEVDRLAAQRDSSLAQTSKELEAARLSAEEEMRQLHAQIERVKGQRETASAQAVA